MKKKRVTIASTEPQARKVLEKIAKMRKKRKKKVKDEYGTYE